MTLEVELTDANMTMADIMSVLNQSLPISLAIDIMTSPDRFHDVQITFNNQSKKARADEDEVMNRLLDANILALEESMLDHETCQLISCLTVNESHAMYENLKDKAEWVYILYLSFIMTEGQENETATDIVVARMISLITENSFEIPFEGLKIKFTTLHERNIHSEKDLIWWCKDGDLASYGSGEFSMVDSNGKNWSHSPGLHLLKMKNETHDLLVRIHQNGKVYWPHNYVANIMFQSSSPDLYDYKVTGEVMVCENRWPWPPIICPGQPCRTVAPSLEQLSTQITANGKKTVLSSTVEASSVSQDISKGSQHIFKSILSLGENTMSMRRVG